MIKRKTTLGEFDQTETMQASGLKWENGAFQSGSISIKTENEGADSFERTVHGTVEAFTYPDKAQPLKLETITVNFTEAVWGEILKNSDEQEITFNGGVATETRRQNYEAQRWLTTALTERATTWRPNESHRDIDIIPSMISDGKAASGKVVNRRDFVETKVGGVLTAGTLTTYEFQETDYEVRRLNETDISNGKYRSGHEQEKSKTRFYTRNVLNGDQMVVDGAWNKLQSNVDVTTETQVKQSSYWKVQNDTSFDADGKESGSHWEEILNQGTSHTISRRTGLSGRDANTLAEVVNYKKSTTTSRESAWSSSGNGVSNSSESTHTGASNVDNEHRYTVVNGQPRLDWFSIYIKETTESSSSHSTTNLIDWRTSQSKFNSSSLFEYEVAGTPTAFTGSQINFRQTTSSYRTGFNGAWETFTYSYGSDNPTAVTHVPIDYTSRFFFQNMFGWVPNLADPLRIVGGSFELLSGAALTLGSGGVGGVLGGVGLIAMGLDNIITGYQNIRYGQIGHGHSAHEYAIYWVTGSHGAAVGGSVALSMGLMIGPSLLRGGASGRILLQANHSGIRFSQSLNIPPADLQAAARLFEVSGNARAALTPAQIAEFELYLNQHYGTFLLQDGPELVSQLFNLGVPLHLAKRMRIPHHASAAFWSVSVNGIDDTFILYRRSVSAFDLVHEHGHLLHYSLLGRTHAWWEIVSNLQREQWVYDYLRMNHWNLMTNFEQWSAAEYIFRLGGFVW